MVDAILDAVLDAVLDGAAPLGLGMALLLVQGVTAPPAGALVVDGRVTGGAALDQGGRFVALVPPFDVSLPPNTVGANTVESADLHAFDEDQNILVDEALAVDIGQSPEAGTVVASHYVFFDPGPSTTQHGFVRFDAPIIGVATRRGTLRASDWLANTGVTYLNPGARGLERTDRVWIDPDDPFRLVLNWRASSPGDYVRVFTEASPAFVNDGRRRAAAGGVTRWARRHSGIDRREGTTLRYDGVGYSPSTMRIVVRAF
ncbi:MAG: hypothetical protein AAF565_02605 [Pseudomonadota bacterium]